jgi:hypothetical protein
MPLTRSVHLTALLQTKDEPTKNEMTLCLDLYLFLRFS